MDQAFPPSISRVEKRLGANWRAIRKAWTDAQGMKSRVESAIKHIPSSDMSFVVFGSLARGEWTAGSDLDWTLLIDGFADPKHQDAYA